MKSKNSYFIQVLTKEILEVDSKIVLDRLKLFHNIVESEFELDLALKNRRLAPAIKEVV